MVENSLDAAFCAALNNSATPIVCAKAVSLTKVITSPAKAGRMILNTCGSIIWKNV